MKRLRTFLSKFCCGCGACLGVCPQESIRSRVDKGIVTLEIDENSCTGCNMCAKVCPVINYMYYESAYLTFDSRMERCLKAFVCYANDDQIRWKGASGGVITTLLLRLLMTKSIDGALVTRMKERTCESYIAETEEEILASQGSTYFPTFGLQHVRELLKSTGHYAIVGLPCQIDALKTTKRLLSDLRRKVYVSLGLFCLHVNEPWYLDYVIERICRVELRKVVAITPRRGGWPGTISIESLDGEEKISYSRFWYPLPLYHFTSPLGCVHCTNHFNRNADISFGDAWFLRTTETDKLGSSVAIARTTKGLSLLEEARAQGELHLDEISPKKIYGSKSPSRSLSPFMRRSSLKRALSKYIEALVTGLPTFHASIIRNRIIRRIIYNMPLSPIRAYCRLYGFTRKSVLNS